MGEFLLLIIKKAPLLTNSQLERLASIAADLAQVVIASVVIPYLIDKSTPAMVVLGLSAAILFWAISLFIERRRS